MFTNCVFLLVILSIGPAIHVHANEFQSAENFEPCQNLEDFQCANGKCIASELECDGKKDCPDGGDESEVHCGMFKLFIHLPFPFYLTFNRTWPSNHFLELKECKPPKYYTCKDINKTCIGQNFRCDGHYDCPTNDDEENCTEYVPYHEVIECNSDEFTCMTDNMCISMEYMCDGIKHCIDGSDETMGCLDVDKKCKGFVCKNKHCLTDKSWVCDGVNDCGDGSDERNCSKNIDLLEPSYCNEWLQFGKYLFFQWPVVLPTINNFCAVITWPAYRSKKYVTERMIALMVWMKGEYAINSSTIQLVNNITVPIMLNALFGQLDQFVFVRRDFHTIPKKRYVRYVFLYKRQTFFLLGEELKQRHWNKNKDSTNSSFSGHWWMPNVRYLLARLHQHTRIVFLYMWETFSS